MADPRGLLRAATARLTELGAAAPRVEAELLLAHATGRSRGTVVWSGDVGEEDARGFRDLVERRAAAPLQHLTGEAHFRHLTLEVGPGVFVPRPETEVLAGEAIDEARRRQADGGQPVVVDLCSGSGAVALAVATEVPGARVVAVEISDDACAYARRNVAAVDADVEVVQADIADVPVLLPDLAGRVDVVTANPPYIPLTEFETVPAEVRDHDPAAALWSGADGLDATRAVEEVAAALLIDDGLVLSEHADSQGTSAPDVFIGSGRWRQVRDERDLNARPRYVWARRSSRSTDHLGQ